MGRISLVSMLFHLARTADAPSGPLKRQSARDHKACAESTSRTSPGSSRTLAATLAIIRPARTRSNTISERIYPCGTSPQDPGHESRDC